MALAIIYWWARKVHISAYMLYRGSEICLGEENFTLYHILKLLLRKGTPWNESSKRSCRKMDTLFFIISQSLRDLYSCNFATKIWAGVTKCLVNILNPFNKVKSATLWIYSFLLTEWKKFPFFWTFTAQNYLIYKLEEVRNWKDLDWLSRIKNFHMKFNWYMNILKQLIFSLVWYFLLLWVYCVRE